MKTSNALPVCIPKFNASWSAKMFFFLRGHADKFMFDHWLFDQWTNICDSWGCVDKANTIDCLTARLFREGLINQVDYDNLLSETEEWVAMSKED